jgi:predicted PurR-regulated permease PerM
MLQPPTDQPLLKEGPATGHPLGPVIFASKLLTFALLAGLLYWGRVVAIPLALAILLSFTLKPAVRWLQCLRVPRIVAVILTVALACGALAGFAWVVGMQLAELSRDLPQYRDNVTEKIRSVREMMRGGTVEKLQGTMESLAAELSEDSAGEKTLPPGGQSDPHVAGTTPETQAVPVYILSPRKLINVEALAALLPVVDPLTTAALVLILVVLILLRWEDLRSRIISFSGHDNLSTATRACDDAGQRISRYLVLQLLLNGSYGLVFAIGLYLIGVPYAALWGLCAGVFRYLPYVGPVIGGTLPVLFSLITAEGWMQPLWVGGLILVMELVSNNVLEPWLYGSRLGLSEVGLITAAVAWTFLWGPVGLLLATPMTVCLVVLGQYIPAFSIFTRLLSDMPVMAPHFRLYQRILADDPREAEEIARASLQSEDTSAVIDGLLVPALALADRDQSAGLLSDADEEQAAAYFKRAFAAVTADSDPVEAAPAGRHLSVIVWPVTPMSACAAPWLAWMLRDLDCEVVTLQPDTLSAEAAGLAQEKETILLCLLRLGDGPVRRERQLAKRIAKMSPDLPVIVARLGSQTPPAEDEVDLTLTRSLAETCAVMRPLIQQALLSDPQPMHAETRDIANLLHHA